jgi:hypothetical protein
LSREVARRFGLRRAFGHGQPDIVDDHGGAVEPFVADRLEAPLELGDDLLVRIFARDEMEDLLVVSLFDPVFYLREVT